MNAMLAKVSEGKFRHPHPHGNEYVPAGIADDLLRACLLLLDRMNDMFPHDEADKGAVRFAEFAIRRAGHQPQETEE